MTPPEADPPPEADTPSPETDPPEVRHPPPPHTEDAGRYSQRAGGTHPTGMQSCTPMFVNTNHVRNMRTLSWHGFPKIVRFQYGYICLFYAYSATPAGGS